MTSVQQRKKGMALLSALVVRTKAAVSVRGGADQNSKIGGADQSGGVGESSGMDWNSGASEGSEVGGSSVCQERRRGWEQRCGHRL